MNIRTIFAHTFSRFTTLIGYQHYLMVLSSISIILLSILLAGCTSHGWSNVYLLSLQYTTTIPAPTPDPTQLNPNIGEVVYNVTRSKTENLIEVRAAYRGLCVIEGDGHRFCSNSVPSLAKTINEKAGRGRTKTDEEDVDPLNLFWIAKNFKDKIVFDGLIYIAILLFFIGIVLMATFPRWHEERSPDGSEILVKPFPSRQVTQAALACTILGFAFGLVSILWQHVNSSAAASMATSLTYGSIESHVGTRAMILGWAAMGITVLVAVGQMILIASLWHIRQLVDDGLYSARGGLQ